MQERAREHAWALHLYAAISVYGFERLKELDFSNSHCGDTGVELLAFAMGRPLCSIRAVNLSNCDITDVGMGSVVDLCMTCGDLLYLDLRSNSITTHGLKLLTKHLCEHHTLLATLLLGDNLLSDNAMNIMSSLKLKYLEVANNSQLQPLPEMATDIMVASLETLYASRKVIATPIAMRRRCTIADAVAVGTAPVATRARDIFVVRNNTILQGVPDATLPQHWRLVLHTALRMFVPIHLTAIDLTRCIPKHTIVASFASALEAAPMVRDVLRMLAIGSNHLRKLGMETLAPVLQRCPALSILNVQDNMLCAGGAALLTPCMHLTVLLLAMNSIDDTVTLPPNLRYVDLSSNRITKHGANAIVAVCSAAQRIDLRCNMLAGWVPVSGPNVSVLHSAWLPPFPRREESLSRAAADAESAYSSDV